MEATGATRQTLGGKPAIEAMLETLAAAQHHRETLGDVAHDARNMMTALSLYCELLDEPGVLTPGSRHYAAELRLVAEASRKLVEKLSAMDPEEGMRADPPPEASRTQARLFSASAHPRDRGDAAEISYTGGGLIPDLREELLAIRNVLAAIAGPSISLDVTARGGSLPVSLSGENLIRAMVNLVRNAAESMQGRGAIQILLSERPGEDGASTLVLSVEDNGPGIDPALLDKVFEPGFTTRAGQPAGQARVPASRGLGLSITRSMIEAAGGSIRAENLAPHGAHFVITLPVRWTDAGAYSPALSGTANAGDAKAVQD